MVIVDSHVHLYPPEINASPSEWAAKTNESLWAVLCTRVRKSGQPVQRFPSIHELLEAMDTASVERAVLQGWYWEKHDSCRLQNRFYARCLREHPDRISACATVQPRAGRETVEEELRWIEQNGFCGLGELSPHSQGVAIDDPVWRVIVEWAGSRRLPVLLHVTESTSKAYSGRVLTPLGDFIWLAQSHPETTFVLAHWGARLPLDPAWGEKAKALRNVFFDTAASPLIYDPNIFPQMIAAVGADRILFGSDYPLILFPKIEKQPSIKSFVAAICESGLSAAEQSAIFCRTAREIFRL